jgi:acetyl esterase/lipase
MSSRRFVFIFPLYGVLSFARSAIAPAAEAPSSQPSTVATTAPAANVATTAPSFTRIQDIVYGRSYGAALTLDIYKPTAKANGAAVIMVVSGGWFSAHELLDTPLFDGFVKPLTRGGYTVFAVCHACQPKFQIPEIIGNINRSVRFVRFHAKDFGIDPNRIGITGGSAGGHLSLMQGVAPEPPKPDSQDPVDKVSAKVQAVACFFPPTDFLNYGKQGENAIGRGILAPFKAAFDFHELDPKTHVFVPITDEKRILEIGKAISPADHVSADDPPTLIIHGDADPLVPIQQSQLMIEKLKAAKVPAELSIKHGAGHGWPDIQPDMEKVIAWFDQYLAPGKP